MPSKGNKVVPVRMPPELVAEIEEAITRANNYRHDAPYDVSEFIRAAVREKLAKMARSRTRKGRGE